MPQCQFLFSAVFGFRNPTQEILSELDGTKTREHILVREGVEEAHQGDLTHPRRSLGLARAWAW